MISTTNVNTNPTTMKGGIAAMPKTIRNNFILLITEVPDNDRAAETTAPAGQEIMYYKLRYSLPYSDFGGLRTMQVKLRRTAYGKGKRVTAVIDLSEWLGHENDEYLDITMKFLHDKRSRMDYIFTVGDASAEKTEKLMRSARKYMRGIVVRDDTFNNTEKLAAYIGSRFAEPAAAQLLAEMLRKPRMRELLGYTTVDAMCEEILSRSPIGVIRSTDVSAYLRYEYSMPYIADKTTALEYAERSDMLLPSKETGTAA